jgi:hypothetical protein
LAVGLITLQLFTLGHLTLEQHTVSASGAVVEVHGSGSLHGHEDRSWCEREAADDQGWPDAPCQGKPLSLREAEPRQSACPRRFEVTTLVGPRTPVQVVVAVWLWAPKASPPATHA